MPDGRAATDRRGLLLACAALALAVLAVYWQTAGFGFTAFDDGVYVTENPHLRGGLTPRSAAWALGSGYASNWHPLTWLSHLADVSLFGLDPKGHHLVSVLLHAANAVLLLLALRALTGRLGRSAFVAGLFALHPLHVESVAWVAERKDVLSTFFWMLTLLAYAGYARRPGGRRYALLAGAFALGLMAKPMLVSLPLVLLLLDLWPLGRFAAAGGGWKAARRLLVEKLPLVALAAASAAVTFHVQQAGGAVGTLERYPLGVRLANAAVAYVGYLVKTLWPARLAAFYPHPGDALPAWRAAVSVALLAALTWAAARGGRRRPYVLAGWLWYLVTLVPVIGLVQVGAQAMADRYTYVPLVGLFIVVAWGVPDLVARRGGTETGRPADPARARALAAAAIALLLALGVVAHRQAGYWRDTVSLFERAVAVTSDNALAQNNLGRALYDRGDREAALAHYREALRIDPRYVDARLNLAVYHSERGEDSTAAAEYREVLGHDGRNARAHHNLAVILGRRGRIREAIEHFRAAIRSRPDYGVAHHNLAKTLRDLGRNDEAESECRLAVRLMPGNGRAVHDLGTILARRSDLSRAIDCYRQAVAAEPGYATGWHDLGVALQAVGDPDGAVSAYERSLAIEARNPDAHANLGALLVARGRLDEGIAHYRQALWLQPDFAAARDSLARALRRRAGPRGGDTRQPGPDVSAGP